MSVASVTITLPDGNTKSFEGVVTPYDVAASIGPGLAKAALAAKVDGELVDISFPIEKDANLDLITTKSPESLEILRHTCAHLMAQAIKRLRPDAILEDGPSTEEGFWYDIKTEPVITPEDFPAIEKAMQEIVKENLPIKRMVMTRDEALKLFNKRGERFKVDLIERIPEGDTISAYEQGEFVDLCRGPHLPSTGAIKAFKMMSVAGAYWKGDANNEQLCRVKGTAFHDKKALKKYIQMLEEARKRDHRKVGRELDLFMHHEWAAGETIWLDRGNTLYRTLRQMMSDLCKEVGYQEVFTPMLFKSDLFKTSGHWQHYKEDMYHFEEGEGDNTEDFAIKPMNCPCHMLIFKDKRRSYRELPFRVFDQGVLHRNEASGTLSGLTRVRQFCQDDAHIFLSQNQIEDEIAQLISLIKRVYSLFGMEFAAVYLSTRPDDYMGEKETWDQAEIALENAIKRNELEFSVNEGDGAFYGPKIDFIVRDVINREWQTATIQLDYQLPSRFGLKFVNKNNEDEVPVVVHRAIFGSFERFIAILIEHYGGNFPAWLAPEQVRVLTISEKFNEYGQEVLDALKAIGIRATLDDSGEKIGSKIREGRNMRIPYLLTVGEREMENKTLSVRAQVGGDQGSMPLTDFITKINEEKTAKF